MLLSTDRRRTWKPPGATEALPSRLVTHLGDIGPAAFFKLAGQAPPRMAPIANHGPSIRYLGSHMTPHPHFPHVYHAHTPPPSYPRNQLMLHVFIHTTLPPRTGVCVPYSPLNAIPL